MPSQNNTLGVELHRTAETTKSASEKLIESFFFFAAAAAAQNLLSGYITGACFAYLFVRLRKCLRKSTLSTQLFFLSTTDWLRPVCFQCLTFNDLIWKSFNTILSKKLSSIVNWSAKENWFLLRFTFSSTNHYVNSIELEFLLTRRNINWYSVIPLFKEYGLDPALT